MQQPTSRQLYAYWDHIRNGRIAPRRFEIEPAKIASLLPETFIAEGAGLCEQFGRELRSVDFLTLWKARDRDALAPLLRNVWVDAAVGHGEFLAYTDANREARFEFILLPLIHTSETINRLLGSITAIEPAFWLGSEPLTRLEIAAVGLHWHDGTPAFASRGAEIIRLRPQRFRVLAGRAEGRRLARQNEAVEREDRARPPQAPPRRGEYACEVINMSAGGMAVRTSV
ncbi:MAG: PAS domain-containing protein, partial [Methyloceanibacter sp.]